ncbi:MAG TPA: hypothetical protein VIC85_17245 [Ktedonobacterales bacterium]
MLSVGWTWREAAPRLIAFCALGLALLACVACGSASGPQGIGGSVSAATATSTSTTTPAPFTCASMTPGPGTLGAFPVPPGTISTFLSGAAGAGFWMECTPNSTAQNITAYLTLALRRAGWSRWNPQANNANGCGTEPNDFWQWTQSSSTGGTAVGWRFGTPGLGLPRWSLVFCSLTYGC